MIAVLLGIALLQSASAAGLSAIWIWEQETFRFLDEQEWRDEVLAHLDRDGFNTLYLYADSWKERSPIVDEPALYEAAISAAHERGFRVEALLGSAYLGTNRFVMPDKREDANAMIERVIAYNAKAGSSARFDAIHLDIEPYTLPEWKKNRKQVAEYYVDAAREWRTVAHREGTRIEIGAAIPFWFDRVERESSSLAVALQEAFDYVALMDYRDEAEGRDGIIAHARNEVSLATRLGRKVIVGVETAKTDLDKLTFAEEGRKALERELTRVRAAFAGDEGFGGTAVHHLATYLAMKD
jgi:hypothetical protein